MNKIKLLIPIFILVIAVANAQSPLSEGQIHGSIEIDAQYYNPDSLIGAPAVPSKLAMNTYDQLDYTNGRISAGVRYEAYEPALQGYDSRYNGSGFPYKYISYKADNMEVTVGNYYEQFGSGLILRSYWQPQLGVDNSFNGVRVKFNPYRGIYLKGLIGTQRYYWGQGAGTVRGVDGEINLNELFDSSWHSKTKIIIGGSFVSKYQDTSNSPTYNLPANVGMGGGRITINRGGFNFYTEYAYKSQDPSTSNQYLYNTGQALLVRTGYSQKGFAVSLSGERIDNMSYRSDRSAINNDLTINYLPALPRDETYQLMAFYPYASQPNGEMGLDGEVRYTIPKESKLGGHYGTEIDAEYSAISSLDTTNLNDLSTKREGYTSQFFGMGKTAYFDNFTIEIKHKFSTKFRMIAEYAYELYNKNVIQNEAGYANIISNIGVLDGYYRVAASNTLHMELQGMQTMQDQGNWVFGMAEMNFGSDWFLGVLDEYNYGNSIPEDRIHYFTVTGGYTKNALRITLGYGKQRAGILCVGGVCRQIPASNGFSLSITNSF